MDSLHQAEHLHGLSTKPTKLRWMAASPFPWL